MAVEVKREGSDQVRYQGPSQELDQIWAEAVFLWTVAESPCISPRTGGHSQ